MVSGISETLSVLMVTQNSGPYGSIQAVVTDTTKWMVQNTSWRVYAANISPKRLPEDNPYVVRARAFGADLIQYETRSKLSLSLLRWLVRDIRERCISITHGHGYKSDVHLLLATTLCNIPFVSTLHTWTEHDWKDRFYSWVDQRILRYADRCIAVSNGMKQIAVSKGIPAERITVVHNWVNTNEILDRAHRSPLTRSDIGVEETDTVFLVPARLSPEKGHRYLIEAAKNLVGKYPQLRLLFAGEGYYRSRLEEIVRQQGLQEHVLFLGYRRDIHRIMHLSDWVVLPSFKEGLPLSLLEAMALKKPIIATNVSGVPEIVQDGVNGYLVTAGSSEHLSEALERALREQDTALAFGSKGYEMVITYFHPDRQIPKIVQVYEEVLQQRRSVGLANRR